MTLKLAKSVMLRIDKDLNFENIDGFIDIRKIECVIFHTNNGNVCFFNLSIFKREKRIKIIASIEVQKI